MLDMPCVLHPLPRLSLITQCSALRHPSLHPYPSLSLPLCTTTQGQEVSSTAFGMTQAKAADDACLTLLEKACGEKAAQLKCYHAHVAAYCAQPRLKGEASVLAGDLHRKLAVGLPMVQGAAAAGVGLGVGAAPGLGAGGGGAVVDGMPGVDGAEEMEGVEEPEELEGDGRSGSSSSAGSHADEDGDEVESVQRP